MSYETLIDASTLAAKLDRPDWLVFDCRFNLTDTTQGEQDYRESHIPGAYYAHLDRDLSSPITPQSGRHPLPEIPALCRWLGDHGLARETQVVAYDDTGGTMAVRLWWLLRWLGHTQVAVLDGGWQAWRDSGQSTDQALPDRPASIRFACRPDERMLISTSQIETQLRSDSRETLIVDARTDERFRGEAEPIDPVAGHIPGAVNLPLQQNLGPDGRFKDAASLRRIYEQVIGSRSAQATAQMCGSGVTACHNLLAMEIAGLGGGRLYAGSWSEWIRDSGRPVATGHD